MAIFKEMQATKVSQGHYNYRGFEVEKMESGQWNIKEIGSDFWQDAANAFWSAKQKIDRWIDND